MSEADKGDFEPMMWASLFTTNRVILHQDNVGLIGTANTTMMAAFSKSGKRNPRRRISPRGWVRLIAVSFISDPAPLARGARGGDGGR